MSGILIIICAIVVFMLGLVAGVMLERVNRLRRPKPMGPEPTAFDLEKTQTEIDHCEHKENGLRCDVCEYESLCDSMNRPTEWTGALGGF